MLEFSPLGEDHLPRFRDWLNQEHIKPFWQEPESDAEFREKFLVKLPQRGVHAFIIVSDGSPIGYIQYYDASKIGGGWWENENPGTFGIDLMIGEASSLGKGLGPRIIDDFVTLIRSREKDITSFIIDPEPGNTKAIRAFEKAGFAIEAEIKTPNGPSILMRRPR